MTDSKVTIRGLSDHFRSGKSNLREDFFEPCFQHCHRYRRAAGYFSSTALLSWLTGISRLVQDGEQLKIELIISHELSPEDAKALRSCHDAEERQQLLTMTADRVIGMIIALKEHEKGLEERVGLFAWLVARGHVELRFAFPIHVEDAGIFHEKIGIFDFPWGDSVAFTGSANETGSGHSRNYESIDVYRSWIAGDGHRVETKALQFDEAWDGNAEGLEVVPMSEEALKLVNEVARKPSRLPKAPAPAPVAPVNMWAHQDEAISRFLAAKRGILEMATGTGKTKTSLRILSGLIARGEIIGAIISTDGNDLLAQWCEELEGWVNTLSSAFVIYRHFNTFHELGRFALSPSGGILVVSRSALPTLMRRLPTAVRTTLAIVHDEVHGLGMPSLRAGLRGQHAAFPYVLGLSATPDRAYDHDGNEFIETEVGKSIFRFPLEAAIARGILCEFDYVPLEYELTENDRQRLSEVYSRQAARAHGGTPMSDEEVWIEISKVYKTAEMKPYVFAEHLERNPDSLKRSIIFVETKEYGEKILEILHGYTNLYRTYYAEDDAVNLVRFARGEIECLVTCHRISQGIDIRSLKTVFLFSSARAKLETVQRIGRCLRIDSREPEKRALVVDFVRPQEDGTDRLNADVERREWLEAISKTRRGDEVVY